MRAAVNPFGDGHTAERIAERPFAPTWSLTCTVSPLSGLACAGALFSAAGGAASAQSRAAGAYRRVDLAVGHSNPQQRPARRRSGRACAASGCSTAATSPTAKPSRSASSAAAAASSRRLHAHLLARLVRHRHARRRPRRAELGRLARRHADLAQVARRAAARHLGGGVLRRFDDDGSAAFERTFVDNIPWPVPVTRSARSDRSDRGLRLSARLVPEGAGRARGGRHLQRQRAGQRRLAHAVRGGDVRPAGRAVPEPARRQRQRGLPGARRRRAAGRLPQRRRHA